MPERGAVLQRAREIVEIARRYGYSSQELIDIILSVGGEPVRSFSSR